MMVQLRRPRNAGEDRFDLRHLQGFQTLVVRTNDGGEYRFKTCGHPCFATRKKTGIVGVYLSSTTRIDLRPYIGDSTIIFGRFLEPGFPLSFGPICTAEVVRCTML